VLGERLKKLRKEKRITQEELGKKVNVTKVSISGYENGNRNPDTETLQKLADFFDVTTDYLLGRTDKPNSVNKDEDEFQKFINDPELERWHRELPQNDEEDLRRLRKMWDLMQESKKNKKK